MVSTILYYNIQYTKWNYQQIVTTSFDIFLPIFSEEGGTSVHRLNYINLYSPYAKKTYYGRTL